MLMAFGVIPLNVIKAGRIFEGWLRPVQPTHPSMQSRKASADVFHVDFEMLSVDRIEANDGGEQADVGFCDASAEEVGSRTGLVAQV